MKELPLVIVFALAAIVLPIAAAWCIGCAGAPPTVEAPTAHTLECEGRYALCVTDSRTIEDYKQCRAAVDAACLDGGTP